jgi:hypothetical protein
VSAIPTLGDHLAGKPIAVGLTGRGRVHKIGDEDGETDMLSEAIMKSLALTQPQSARQLAEVLGRTLEDVKLACRELLTDRKIHWVPGRGKGYMLGEGVPASPKPVREKRAAKASTPAEISDGTLSADEEGTITLTREGGTLRFAAAFVRRLEAFLGHTRELRDEAAA